MDKRGLAESIEVVLIIFIVILMMLNIYLIVNYFMKKSIQNDEIKVTTTSLELEKNLMVLEKGSGKLQISLRKDAQLTGFNMIKAIVLGENSGSYRIFDIPTDALGKTYVLNVSMIGDIKEILIYPVMYTPVGQRSQTNVLTRSDEDIDSLLISPIKGIEKTDYYSKDDIIFTTVTINPDLPVINPAKDESGKKCFSDWICDDWTECFITYDIDTVINSEINMSGIQKRSCYDQNKCLDDLIDTRSCDEGSYVTIKRFSLDDKNIFEIYDKNNKLVSRLEYLHGEHSVLNIDVPVV